MESEILPRIENNRKQTAWEEEWKKASSQIDKCKEILDKQPQPLLETLRVNQVDAIRLDDEINDVLSNQFMKTFEFFKPQSIARFKPELVGLLDFLVYYFSVYSTGTTYGNYLQNLNYRQSKDLSPISKSQKIFFGLFTVGVKWLWSRLSVYLTPKVSIRETDNVNLATKIWKAMNHVERFYRIASLLNFLLFLYNGKYVSLVARLLQMRLIYQSKSVKRTVSFEYMNRQLVWHEFTEFLMFIIPLMQTERVKGILSSLFSSNLKNSSLPASACVICAKDPFQIPYETSCGHLFCYYCLKQNTMVNSNYSCPRCGSTITTIKRYQAEEE